VQVTRTVNVIPDTTAPVITLVGNATINLNVGDTYNEQGATATDNIDGDISGNIVIGGDAVNPAVAGTYVVTYDVSDAAGNPAVQAIRIVIITSLPTDVILHEGYFETGWDNWEDGGSDCARTATSNSYEGSFSIRIRDNSGVSSSMTLSNIDVSPYEQVEIDFYFYAFNMNNNEDFWVRFFDGSNWNTVATYVRGIDFNNDTFYNATVTITSTQYNFAVNSGFRFQCDASGNNDQVFIDQVIITGIGIGSPAVYRAPTEKTDTTLDITENFVERNELKVYPNPVKGDILNIKTLRNTNMSYKIVNMLGQVVKTGDTDQEIIVDYLEAGMYYIEVNDGSDKMMKRFIKE
ncbi:immunoglobulin-like domain-containing protein, partial [Flavobacteriaceae bacterium SZ-1-7]|uniref:immunoglobulin-like domain-containing protein n=1 Tax=Tamlana sedimenti TaxID=3134126 RepID=UPI0031230FAA